MNLNPLLLRFVCPGALMRVLGAAMLAATVSNCGLIAAQPRTDAPVASVSEVERALQRFIQAWQTKNVEATVAAFASDAVAVDPSPPGRFVGTNAIRAWITGDFAVLEHITIPISDLQIKVDGPVAWLSARYVFSAQMGGKPLIDPGSLSMVWLKQSDGSYKVSLFHASSLPPPDAGSSPANK
jgi:ketosteroid isomerase-like protein